MRKLISLSAPVGGALVLAFFSLSAVPWMVEIGRLLEPNRVAEFPKQTILGALGWLLVGVGVLNTTFTRRRESVMPRMAYLLATIAFVAASIAIGMGAWWLNATFRYLAMAETIEPDVFNQRVASAKLPLLLGWTGLLIGGVFVFIADFVSSAPMPPTRRSVAARAGTFLATFCCVVFLLAVVWSGISNRDLGTVVANPSIEPSVMANGVNGLIRSELLTAIGSFACGCVLITRMLNAGTTPSDLSDQSGQV